MATRERLINRSRQGAIGEASAIEWFARAGATVFLPAGPSPHCDLIAEVEGVPYRVQVKTSTTRARGADTGRYEVGIATRGGNRSWNGTSKLFDPRTVDLLFVLVGDGRRWLIPVAQIAASTGISVGGTRYADCEIEPAAPIDALIYGSGGAVLESTDRSGERRSGRAGRDCKSRASVLSGFESHLPHRAASGGDQPRFAASKYERRPGRSGLAAINQKRRITIPQSAMVEADLRDGDWLAARADGPGRIVLEKTGLPVWAEEE